jgi:hypothetical protein
VTSCNWLQPVAVAVADNFLIRQPVAVAVGPNKAQQPDPTGPHISIREVQASFTHIEERSWLEWGAEILPVLRSKVEEEETAAAEEQRRRLEEEEVLRSLEADRIAREEEEQLQRADRERREDEATAAFDEDKMSLEEYQAALRAIEEEYTTPATTSSLADTQSSKDDDSEKFYDLGSKSSSKRKAVAEKEPGGLNNVRVRPTPKFVTSIVLTMSLCGISAITVLLLTPQPVRSTRGWTSARNA